MSALHAVVGTTPCGTLQKCTSYTEPCSNLILFKRGLTMAHARMPSLGSVADISVMVSP